MYGAAGHAIALDTQSYPCWAAVTLADWQQHNWTSPTTDARALQRAADSTRVATCWYTLNGSVDVRVTDGGVHRVAAYLIDYDGRGRVQRVEVLDAATGAVLDSRELTLFRNGQYLVWEISGNVRIRVVHTGTTNAVLSGLFFG